MDKVEDASMACKVVLCWAVALDRSWDDHLEHVSDDVDSSFVRHVSEADVEQLSAREIVFLQHIEHDVVDLLARHTTLHLVEVL